MSHTHGSTITNCCYLIRISSPSQENRLHWLRKQSDIISILSEFVPPKDVALELWIWMTDENSSILVLILICLLKRLWEFECQTVCQPSVVRLCVRLDSFGITGPHVETQGIGLVIVLIAGICSNTTSEYQAFVDEVNDVLLRVSLTESTVLRGDFNAHVGKDTNAWKGMIGKHGLTGLSVNGRYLLQLC